MKIKQIVLCCAVAFVTIVVSLAVFWTRGYEYINQLNAENSLEESRLLADILEEGGYLGEDVGGGGEVGAASDAAGEAAAISDFARMYGERYGVHIYLLDMDGIVLADSASETVGADMSQANDLIRDALTGQEGAEVQEGFTWALNMSRSAVPLRIGDFRGVLYTESTLDSLSELNSELMKQIILGIIVCLFVMIVIFGLLQHKVKLPVVDLPAEEPEIQKKPYGKIPRHFDVDTDKVMRFDDIVINVTQKMVWVNGVVTEMPRKEFELLVLLAENRGRVYSRELLIDKVWGYDFSGETRTVDVHIKNLRKRLEDNAKNPAHIITVRGYGYKFI